MSIILKFHNKLCLALRQNEGLISVPAGRFVAAARFRTDKTFAADASLSRRAELPGGVR